MISDLDIHRSANILVNQHGQDAPVHAAMRADAMLEKGDLGGYAVWRRILRAVGELQGTEPRPLGCGCIEGTRRGLVLLGLELLPCYSFDFGVERGLVFVAAEFAGFLCEFLALCRFLIVRHDLTTAS